MILAGFFFLVFFGLWAFSFVFWVLKIIEVARIPEQQYRNAQSEKVTWILVVVLAGIVGAVIWQFAKRDAVLAVNGPRIAPAGWYPDPNGGALRWWDGVQWTESRSPPPPGLN